MRFSAELGAMLSAEFVTSTIEIEVVSFFVYSWIEVYVYQVASDTPDMKAHFIFQTE